MNIDFASPEARDFAETSEEREEREWREAAEENGFGCGGEYREYVDQLERENDETETLDFQNLESGFDGVPDEFEKQFTNQGNLTE